VQHDFFILSCWTEGRLAMGPASHRPPLEAERGITVRAGIIGLAASLIEICVTQYIFVVFDIMSNIWSSVV